MRGFYVKVLANSTKMCYTYGTFDYHDNECKLALFYAIGSCIPNIAYDYFVAPKARAFIGQDNHDYTPHFISHSKSFSVKY